MQIYISRDGETKGPYSIEDVNAYLKDGTLLPTDLACQEGLDEWVPLDEIQFTGLELKQDQSESVSEPSTTHEDPPEPSDVLDVTERIAATGFHQHIYFYKSIGVAILFAILTYWLSESAFRSPPVDDEPRWEWKGWVAALNERNWLRGPKEECGPIYKMMIFFTTNKMERNFRDTRAVTHWVLFCLIVGIGIAIKRIRSWKKKFHQDEVYDEPIISLSLLKKIKYAALIMGFLILCFEIRNGLNRNQRTKNIQFQLAVVKGNIEDVKDRLSDGADVNVRRWSGRPHTKLLSWEDEALLFGNIFGARFHAGYTALHYAARNGQTEILKLLLSNGADVNAKYEDRDITPLDLANSEEHTEIIELLKKNGGKTGQELDGIE